MSKYRTNTGYHHNKDEVKFVVGHVGSALALRLGYPVEFLSPPHNVYIPIEDAEAFDQLHDEEIFRVTGRHLRHENAEDAFIIDPFLT
jgi:hypothetical protein